MKKRMSLFLALTLALSLCAPAFAAEPVTPTPPSWVSEEEYAVFPGSKVYEPENWEIILGLRNEVAWGAINVASLPKELDRGYSKLYDLATDRTAPDAGVLFELALIETRLLYTHGGEVNPYWSNLLYHIHEIEENLSEEQRYSVFLWNARSALRYYGISEELNQSVAPLLCYSGFSVEKLLDSVIFTEEEKEKYRSIDLSQIAQTELVGSIIKEKEPEDLSHWKDLIWISVDITWVGIENISTVRNERVMVPIRAVAEALGAEVTWEQETQQVKMVRAGTTVVMTLDSTEATVDGQLIEMDVAPYALEGRTLIPARYVAEFFGQKVDWDGENRQVRITEDKSVAGDSNLEAWALAMGAIRGCMDQDYPGIFGQVLRSASEKEAMQKRLLSDWGTSNREDLIALIQRMTPHGHNDSFQAAVADANKLTKEEMAYLISISSETDQYMWLYTKSLSEKWGEKGILAWDLSRMSNLVQWGYTAGFLTYEEALELIEPAAQMTAETFSSWEEFYENYLDGYNWWARNNVNGKNLWTVTRGPFCRIMLDYANLKSIFDDTLFRTGVIGLPE